MSTSSSVERSACSDQAGIFKSGDFGGVWRVVHGVVRMDRESGPLRLPVQLALPGDLVGVEALCDLPYQFSASAFTPCRLERVFVRDETHRQALLRQALLQQQRRSQDMANLRTGSVAQRMGHLLGLLGLPWKGLQLESAGASDAVRNALPSLLELSEVVDAKRETVCRVLAQLLPPRSRKGRPQSAASREGISAGNLRLGGWTVANVPFVSAA